jgi:cytochrome oxidase assembly protein ShyY1
VPHKIVRPRWLGLALFVVVVAAACVRLGVWQLDRSEARSAANTRLVTNLAAPPQPADTLLAVGRRVDPTQEWRPVTAVGRYDADRQLLLRNRPFEGATGSHVLVPLVTADRTALLVDRGWIPAGRSATEVVEVPAPPRGEVSVTGRVRLGEPVADEADLGATDVPQRSVARMDPLRIAETLPYPAYGGFVELIEERPGTPTAPRPLPAPTPRAGPHLAYALQWFLFGCIAVGGSILLARRELSPGEPGSPAGPGGPAPETPSGRREE